MNFLSHHAVAHAALPGAAPAFYVGNVLPDLLATSGEGRLRARSLAAPPPAADPDLLQGIRLHLATDRCFHGHPLFVEATAQAGDLLRATRFLTPPRRLFFFAHAFVEVALDGALAERDTRRIDDFYDQFARCDLPHVVAETAALLGCDAPLLGLARTLERFTESRYLYSYAHPDGRAEAMHRIAWRIGMPDLFSTPDDRAALAECFVRFQPILAGREYILFAPPEAQSWYDD